MRSIYRCIVREMILSHFIYIIYTIYTKLNNFDIDIYVCIYQ